MKFNILERFVHSGHGGYDPNDSPKEIPARVAEELYAAGQGKRLQPADAEAQAFVANGAKAPKPKKDEEGGKAPDDPKKVDPPAGDGAPPAPERSELMKTAKDLGIKETNKMKTPELIEAIAAKKAESAGAQGAE